MEQEPNNPGQPDRPDTPTLTEIKSWPATVSVRMAAAAFGISTSHAYELITRNEFPAKVIRLGARRRVVVTESIAHALSRVEAESTRRHRPGGTEAHGSVSSERSTPGDINR
ncbi:MAG TPA: AlpA family phage regulatory protein [Actinophytocola sp.]|uniref:helix-turn-helix transcriptional regulator n=1 Tax=Actinophytocola sp. TaxID=1872138 RepID=UPI002DBDE700|nr:AlpA family phage regulatory protein [Actinophytocola sp.]HEU5472745.1 AlpA family phage regulatory protein [Actinophytocola sp.]